MQINLNIIHNDCSIVPIDNNIYCRINIHFYIKNQLT